ncbi:MAG: bifunctional phosphopantothenoylcysteine decarboxylase/phosphopantothenate--cysteine ligase CoaBC [Desulfobacterales bacterium]
MKTVIDGKKIVLGICGGIAAYKAVELLRGLKKLGAQVRVVMTQNASWFIAPLTFQALSGLPVSIGLFRENDETCFKHIDWAQEADAVVIAPATADMIGKLANGIADDALSTFMLAVTAVKIICPSMNTHMYENRVVQRNLDILESDGYIILEPGAGELACGTIGPGRLPEPAIILDRIVYHLTQKDFLGENVLVTAGPTQEPMDPVRFISNPSSGKMGYAIAAAAEHRGGCVTLITGPTNLDDPLNVKIIKVRTADQMASAVFSFMKKADIIIKSAAVSDFRPKITSLHKIKKEDDDLTVELEKTQDILKSIGEKKRHQILVGFAAETQNLQQNASKKLTEKNLDLIVGNIIGEPGSGFGSESNKVTLFYRDGSSESLPSMQKSEVAHALLDRIKKFKHSSN